MYTDILFFDSSTLRQGLTKPEPLLTELADNEQRYCCAICKSWITSSKDAIRIQDRHEHERSNPQQQSFRFRCFVAAPGCVVAGTPTDEYTWFAGYRWRLATCKSCTAQLGWHFQNQDSFFALIAQQITKCPSDGR